MSQESQKTRRPINQVDETGESSRSRPRYDHAGPEQGERSALAGSKLVISDDCDSSGSSYALDDEAHARLVVKTLREARVNRGSDFPRYTSSASKAVLDEVMSLTDEDLTQMLVENASRERRLWKEINEAMSSRGPGRFRRLPDNRKDNIFPTPLKCQVCAYEYGLGDQFYSCLNCGEKEGDSFNSGHMCPACFFSGAAHPHKRFRCLEIYPMGIRPPPTISRDNWTPDGQMQSSASGPSKALSKDSPISQVLRHYLNSVDLSGHLHADAIHDVMGIKIVQFVSKPEFQTLRHWSIVCFVVSDHQFTQRTGQASLMAILSPSQRSSLRLIMEWWFSEIQNSVFLLKTIAYYASICVCPNENIYRGFAKFQSNKYTEKYHGDLLRLFEQEFETGVDGENLLSPEEISVSRKAAVKSACCQRMGHEVCRGYEPSTQSPMLPVSEFRADLTERTSRWRQEVMRACAETLYRIMELDAPHFVVDSFWLLMDVATDGPIELYTQMSLRPETVLEANLLSVTIEPLPWLVAATRKHERPYYLWDRRDEKTIEVGSLDPEADLDYVAVSHTWGRWKTKDSFVTLPGVEWQVPRNDLWKRDVSDLPNMLREVPGHQRYVWFDLVCIPQDGPRGTGEGRRTSREDRLWHLKNQEIKKQAAIFGKATHVVAWMSTMDKYGLDALRSTVQTLVLGCTAYYRTYRSHNNHEMTEESLEKTTAAIFSPNLRQADGKLGTIRDMIPLVQESDEDNFDPTDNPLKYVNRWFTSLWTLQEACVRPDMWVCDKDWNLLRLGPASRRWNKVSLDGIFASLEDSTVQKYLRSTQEEGIKGTGSLPDTNMKDLKAQYNRFDDLTKGKSMSDFSSYVDHFNFLREAAIESGLPEGRRMATWDLGTIDNLFTGAEAASMAYEPQAHTLFDIVQSVPPHVQFFHRMMQGTGMTRLAELRSPLDIIAIGERRECKTKNDRATAIMSAVGATDWFDDENVEEQNLMLGQYPPAFIHELRRKTGHADFFRSRLLNKHAARLVRDAERHTRADAPVFESIGSMLPFSNVSVFDICHAPSGWPLESLPVEEQPGLAEWKVNGDGSVEMPRAAIVASSHMIRPIPGCWINCHQIILDGDGDGVASSRVDEHVGISLDKWLKDLRKRSGTFYLVNISRQRLSAREKMGWSSCHGVILKELRSKVLVKVGAYSLRGHKFYTWPPATRRNWTVL